MTLTTDFGTRQPFVGVMKGVLFARAPHIRVIDLGHDRDAFEACEAGFWLWRILPWFQAGTVHVAVVDPGVGTQRGILIAIAAGQTLLAPDNGLLAPIAKAGLIEAFFKLSSEALASLGIREVSATFHGRDIFAPVAAELASGRVNPRDLGERIESIHLGDYQEATLTSAGCIGTVVAVDRFGNLISNIEVQQLASLRRPVVGLDGRTYPLERTYGSVRAGEYLALINSFGVLEIARSRGDAARTLGLSRGARIEVREGLSTDGFQRS